LPVEVVRKTDKVTLALDREKDGKFQAKQSHGMPTRWGKSRCSQTRGGSQTETLLKTDKVTLVLERDRDGKFQAKTTLWDANKVFSPGDQLRIEVVSGQLVLTRWHSEAVARKLRQNGRGLARPPLANATPLRECVTALRAV
jgi:hypothetical protein